MITGRPPLLTPKQEMQLREDLDFCLSQDNATAEQIAGYLEFGKKGKYEKLKRFHVYYFAKRFGLKMAKAKPEVNEDELRPWLKNTGNKQYFE
jgi:transposase